MRGRGPQETAPPVAAKQHCHPSRRLRQPAVALMVWAKFSDDFPDRCANAELTDAAFRTHMEGVIWCCRRENGGQVTDRDVRRFAETDAEPEMAVKELLTKGFWTKTPVGYLVVEGMEDNPEPEVLRARRAANEGQRDGPARRRDHRHYTAAAVDRQCRSRVAEKQQRCHPQPGTARLYDRRTQTLLRRATISRLLHPASRIRSVS